MKIVTEAERCFKCSRCDKSYTRRDSLTRHFRNVHPTTEHHENRKCDKSYTRPDKHKQHRRNDNCAPKRYACPKCDKSYSHSAGLWRHRKNVHPKMMHLYTCSYCPTIFGNVFLRNRHQSKMHRSVKISSLSLSVKSTAMKKRKQSKRVSTDKKNEMGIVYANKFCCSYCPKFLSNAYSKANHERKHNGERPSRCKFCPASFVHEYTRDIHQRECRSLGNATWCQFCDFHTFVPPKLEAHYKRVHGFQFQSDVEINFLSQQINRESTSKRNSSRKDSKREAGISLSSHNLEEIFRDHILLPLMESSDTVASQKEVITESSKDTDTSEREGEISLLNDKTAEMVQDDVLEPNLEQVKPLEREIEISHVNNRFENKIQDDMLVPNSEQFEDAVPRKKTPTTIEASKHYEHSNQHADISQLSDELDEMSQNGDISKPPLKRSDGTLSKTDVINDAPEDTVLSNHDDEISQLNDELEEMLGIQDDISEPSSKKYERAVILKYERSETSHVEDQFYHDDDILQLNVEREKTTPNDVDISNPSLTKRHRKDPESEINPNMKLEVPSPEVDCKSNIDIDSVDNKQLKFEIEIAQLDNNLKEIFQSTETTESLATFECESEPNNGYRTIDLTGDVERGSVLKIDLIENSDDEFVPGIDLTGNSDDECESRIIVINDDD